MNYRVLIISLFIVLSSCKEKKYAPDGLTKLSDSEIIERVKKRELSDIDAVVYKNQNGQLITLDSLQKMPNIQEFTVDLYADKNGVVKELILRKATEKDKEFQKELEKAAQ